jgi:hypothetical protein
VLAQETYAFSSVVFPVGSGIGQVLAVRSVALLWGTFRYLDMRMSFSKYQAFVRNYTSAYLYIPTVACQYGQGVAGTLMMYPLPSQAYPMEWDCICLPAALAADSDFEALPYPWTDCVQYMAGYMACFGSQRNEDSDRIWKYYDRFMKRARAFSQPNMTANPYGRS